MIYHVQATFRESTAAELLTKLTDGSVAAQRPDGSEIVRSLERAVVNTDGRIEWSERCYCSPPLAHERETVLDSHFDEITTEPVYTYQRYEGTPFMEHLAALAGKA